jgi:hypothetical protein
MIRLLKGKASCQVTMISMAVLMLCSAGRTQSPPSLSINPPVNGATINSAYLGIGFSLTGISNVTSGSVTLKDNAGHSFNY